MRNLTILLLTIMSLNICAQSRSEIVDKKIKSEKVFEQRLDKGFNNKYLLEETTYNSEGRISELRELNQKGEVVKWEKYSYDSNGNCIEEIYLNSTGKIEKRIVTKYSDNFKTSKEYYDSEGRLYRKKEYEYEYR